MPASASWNDHALTALQAAGYRSGESRRRVVELLGRQRCAVTALEIDRRLDGVGRASVYRTLEQLEELGLVQRVDIGGEAAGYERIGPGGDHHHHLVCDSCGAVAPFSDRRLERAIDQVSRGSGFRLSGHDVVLRGECSGCAGRG